MTGFFKTLALLVAIACAVWVGVLWRWQATQRDMSVQDIATYLVALPLTLFVLALLARWAWRGAAAKAAVQGAPAADGTTPTAAPFAPANASVSASDDESNATLLLLAAQVHCAAGSSTAAVLGAAAESQPRPQLDPELVDDDGLPLLTARITELDLDALDLEPARAAVQARRPAWAGAEVADTTRRALAALVLPLPACLDALQPWRQRFGLTAANGSSLPSLAAPAARRSNRMLRVLPSWPADWPEFDVAVGTEWLLQQLAVAKVAAPDRIALGTAPPGGGAACWLEAERLMRVLAHDGHSDVLLLTACHSAIGADAVQRLQAAQQLFTTRSPKQPLPGEAAAVLALSLPGWPELDADAPVDAEKGAHQDPAAPLAILHRAAVMLRDKPIDAPGRSSTQAAQTCIEQALLAAAAPVAAATGPADKAPATAPGGAPSPAALAAAGAAIHDADQHTARSAEALTALLHCLPQLQPADDVLQTGALNGQLGVVAVPLVIAVAAAQAQALQLSCLALSVDDAQMRLALVARPAVLRLEPAAATTASAA